MARTQISGGVVRAEFTAYQVENSMLSMAMFQICVGFGPIGILTGYRIVPEVLNRDCAAGYFRLHAMRKRRPDAYQIPSNLSR